MAQHIRAAIVGSTGYGGVELIRLLQNHPQVTVTSVISSSTHGSSITEGYPHLTHIRDDILDPVDVPLIKSKADVVFTATPSGVSTGIAPQFLDAGLKVIDLAGDFRLKSGALYEQWYKHTAPEDAYLERAVYGLSEVYGDQVKGAEFVSNPGCYPTATLLAIIPALKAGWIQPETLIIDGKSGVSGAGRGLSLGVHYAEINENFKAYKVNKHQHIPEIEQVLGQEAGHPVTTTFTTHLVPMTRGILCTIYATMKEPRTDQELIDLYREYYSGRPFVRVRDRGVWPATKEVWGSNYCDICSIRVVKGAAGQAVQNLNLMMGWDEGLGLQLTPVYP